MEKSILNRVAGSIPIIGPALALLVEHAELGLIRGFVVGLILCAVLIVASEAALFGFNVIRDYIDVHWMAQVRNSIRTDAMDDGNQKYIQKYLEREREMNADRPAKKTAKPFFTAGGEK